MFGSCRLFSAACGYERNIQSPSNISFLFDFEDQIFSIRTTTTTKKKEKDCHLLYFLVSFCFVFNLYKIIIITKHHIIVE